MIVVAARCYNEMKNIDSFLEGYSWADKIVISDGGSTDGSREYLQTKDVQLLTFDSGEVVNGYFWNMDAPHINFVLDYAKSLDPDWIVFDDLDCHPNPSLKQSARWRLENSEKPQVNAFRLYMWGEDQYFPKMNGYFDNAYASLWAWKPKELNIHADPDVRHGTIVGLTSNPHIIQIPNCLLHYSWHPDTIEQKVRKYNAIGLPMNFPLDFAGTPEPLPEWAKQTKQVAK